MFLLFAGDDYYPCGGWNDYRGTFTNQKDAVAKGKELVNGNYDWWHVVDLDTSAEVEWGSRDEGAGLNE